MNLTPANIAQLDQGHTAANRDLDRLVHHVRQLVDQHGPAVGAAVFTAELQTVADPDYLASIAGIAIARLATQEA